MKKTILISSVIGLTACSTPQIYQSFQTDKEKQVSEYSDQYTFLSRGVFQRFWSKKRGIGPNSWRLIKHLKKKHYKSTYIAISIINLHSN